MKIANGLLALITIFLVNVVLASGVEISASTGGAEGSSSTDVVFGAKSADYAYEKIKLDPVNGDLSNTFYGSGSLPWASITKTDTKGNRATAYRSVTGIPTVTTWSYDWGTYSPYSSSAGYGVGAWLRSNVNAAKDFTGGSYGSNQEGDYAGTYAMGSSPSGVGKSSVSNLKSDATAFTNQVSSTTSANYGQGANYIWFVGSTDNKAHASTYHWTGAYGTSSNPARIYSPYVSGTATKSGSSIYGSTSGAYGTSALFRTYAENRGKMYGKDGTYYAGSGDFGFKTRNYAVLKGSVSASAYPNSIHLSPSTNAPSYRTALLLDPYRAEYVGRYGYKDWGYDAFNALMNKGQAVTYFRDSAVTHSRVGTMDDYHVSAYKGHMNNNAISITNAAESDRIVTGRELASMFTKNPQGLIIFAGCKSFYPSANSPIANAVKGKEWLSGGYTYEVNSKGNSLYMSKFFNYLAAGNTARVASQLATEDVLEEKNVFVVPVWTPKTHDFKLA